MEHHPIPTSTLSLLFSLLPTPPVRRVKMTRLRMRVAERLKGAQNTFAMLTTFNEVDMTSLMEMRNSYKVKGWQWKQGGWGGWKHTDLTHGFDYDSDMRI
jgi:pyruvate/2-oxoglutarate dehydrogenase complex dihydrolipoamide acyltransferase (E2) component